MAQRNPPRFYSLKFYADPEGDYQFNYSSDWHLFNLVENQNDALVSPEAQDPQTWLSVRKVILPDQVLASDLPYLKEGLQKCLMELPNCRIEDEVEEVIVNTIKLERVVTFWQGNALRKRKLWLLYGGKIQITICFQGATEEEYDYWLAMANYTFYTFQLPDSFEIGIARDLIGWRKERPEFTSAQEKQGAQIYTRWWKPACQYRLPVSVSAAGYERTDRPVEIDLNLGQYLPNHKDLPFQPVRIVEIDT